MKRKFLTSFASLKPLHFAYRSINSSTMEPFTVWGGESGYSLRDVPRGERVPSVCCLFWCQCVGFSHDDVFLEYINRHLIKWRFYKKSAVFVGQRAKKDQVKNTALRVFGHCTVCYDSIARHRGLRRKYCRVFVQNEKA